MDLSQSKRVLTFLLVVLIGSVGSGVWSASFETTTGWPAFTATYQTRIGIGPRAHIEIFTVSYKGPKDWTVETVADSESRPNEHLSASRLDGVKVTQTEFNGDLFEMPLDEFFGAEETVPPFAELWGNPVASRSELLLGGRWQPIGSDGRIKRTTAYQYSCGDHTSLECGEPFRSVSIVETNVRDRHGLPLSYSEVVDGVSVSEAKATTISVAP